MFSTTTKKIVPVTIIRQLNFDKTPYYNEIFLCQSQLENIVKYCHCLLCIIQNWSCTTYISAKVFNRMFSGIKSEACHICDEPTK